MASRKRDGDLIYIGDMLAWPLFESVATDNEWEWLHSWIEPQWLAYLIEVLKNSDYESTIFLHGKWATIQVLQEKLSNGLQGVHISAQADGTHRTGEPSR